MKKTYTTKCERCAGSGQVYAYKGKPLFCSVMKGQFLHRQYQTSDSTPLEDCKDPFSRLKVLFALKEPQNWGPATCPDCKGQATWSYTLEQLVYNDEGVAVEKT